MEPEEQGPPPQVGPPEEPGNEEPPPALAPEPWRGRKPSKWWVRRQAALAAHRAKKEEERKAQRQAELDFLTETANANQGFALLPSSGPTKEELKAEHFRQFQEEAQRKLDEAKAEQQAYWEKKLKGQTKLTGFFKPSQGCLQGLKAVAGNALAPFRGSRGPLAPACAKPEELPALIDKQRQREMQQRVNLLAAKADSARKARPAQEEPSTPQPAKKRLTQKTRESPFLQTPQPAKKRLTQTTPELTPLPPSSEAATSPGELPLSTLPAQPDLPQALGALLPNTVAVARKPGRPPKTQNVPEHLAGTRNAARKIVAARKASLTNRVESPGALAKKALVDFVQSEGQRSAGQVSPREFWQRVQQATEHTAVQVKQWSKPEEQRRLEVWLEGQRARRQQQVGKQWAVFKSKDTGCRMKKTGEKKDTRPDHFKVFYPQLTAWALAQRDAGHDVSADDLIDEYSDCVESEMFRLEAMQESEPLTPADSQWLELLRKRLAKLRTKDGRKFYKARVKAMTGFSEQKPGLVSPLRPEETACILSLTWQSWDWILNHVFTASASELTNYVIDPEGWVLARASIPLVFWDAVPVYLDPSAGKVLVSVESLQERRERVQARQALRKHMRETALPVSVSLRPHTDAMGATRRDKNRLTLVLRQIIHKVFDLPVGQLPQGSHLPSLLIVQAGQACSECVCIHDDGHDVY